MENNLMEADFPGFSLGDCNPEAIKVKELKVLAALCALCVEEPPGCPS